MNNEQIFLARKKRALYLWVFLLSLLLNGYRIIVTAKHPTPDSVDAIVGLFSIGLLVFAMIATWQFCRAIQIGKLASFLNAIFSPVLFIFQLIVLLRMYARRTDTKLTFLMGEKVARNPDETHS